MAALAARGVACAASEDAGRFVCNYVYYVSLASAAAAAAAGGDATPWEAIFVHVPPLAVLPLAAQLAAVRARP